MQVNSQNIRERIFSSPYFVYGTLLTFVMFASWLLLFHGGPVSLANNDYDSVILWKIRLPKLLASLLVGASLALSGYIFQSVLRNPMSDPYVLGVSSGSALAVATVLTFSSTVSILKIEVASFIGAMLAVLLLLFLFRFLVSNSLVIILIGIGLSFFFSSVITALMSYMEGVKLVYMNSWLVGNVSQPEMPQLYFLGSIFLLVLIITCILSNILDVIQFGEDLAVSSGADHKFFSMLFIVLASFVTAASVTVCGTIGFVGLVVPHVIKLVFRGRSIQMLPLMVIMGAGFLTFCTAIAGMLSLSFEVPSGAVTAFLGAPVLLYLIYRRYRVMQ